MGLLKNKSGIEHQGSKLLKEDVLFIRNHKDIFTQRKLNEFFRVNKTTILRVQNNISYKNI